MKVSGLKYWIGRNYSLGYFTSGIDAIQKVAKSFILKKKADENSDDLSSITASLNEINTNETNIISPRISTPASATDNFYQKFFANDPVNENELELEVLNEAIKKELDSFRIKLSNNNFSFISEIVSSRSFWIKNSINYPLLSDLANILLNINSSSSFVERYFSICGFVSKKKAVIFQQICISCDVCYGLISIF